ncbi:DNA polymerase III subunit delta' [Desulfonema magnum]|uniref:DNA polymerase III subunit delta' n=1 Tax=Desulfonema magnum TaxID=45655 RepID=A0A975BSJ2_9BACT|nr:DNA polymerase III subunit delta' [Desulfonema magnum]QTA90280.1 DNA polymerase III subunit delta [Desulfonema magnum]
MLCSERLIFGFVSDFEFLMIRMSHHKAYKRLITFLQKDAIPHALLFTGIEGVGKRTAAMAFAMACNCSQLSVVSKQRDEDTDSYSLTTDKCNCRSCKKIRSGNHPDITLIEPSGVFIRIGQIREVCHTLGMKPYEARTRVVIIANAHTMNAEAGNALLKVLEEPPDRTVLILTATQTSDLLPTIVSRCQLMRFDPVPREELRTLLIEKQNLGSEDAMVIATLANGSYSRAISMSRSNWINQRNWLIHELEAIAGNGLKPFPGVRVFAFAERLLKSKDILPDLLEVMKTWLRDVILCRLALEAGQGIDPEKVINRDLTNSIQHASRQITVASLLSKIKAIQTAQKSLRSNANLRLTLEVLAMKLAE